MMGLGPSLQKPETLAECLELAYSPAAYPANQQKQHLVFKRPTQKMAISDVKTTPLLGRVRLKKNIQIPKETCS